MDEPMRELEKSDLADSRSEVDTSEMEDSGNTSAEELHTYSTGYEIVITDLANLQLWVPLIFYRHASEDTREKPSN